MYLNPSGVRNCWGLLGTRVGVTAGVDGGTLSCRLCLVLSTRLISAASLAVIVLCGLGMLGAGVGVTRDWESALMSMTTVDGVLLDPCIKLSMLW